MADKLKAKLQKTGVEISASLNRVPQDHTVLTGRDEDDQHPISAITGLEDALADAGTIQEITVNGVEVPVIDKSVDIEVPTKVSDLTNDEGYLTEETDPTVPSWAKQPTKPTYTAAEVGALSEEDAYPLKSAVESNGLGYYKRVSRLVNGQIYEQEWIIDGAVATATLYYAYAGLEPGKTYKVTIGSTETIVTCEYLDEIDGYGLRLDAPDAEVVRIIYSYEDSSNLLYEIRVHGDFEPPELMRIEVALSGGTRTVIGESTAHPSDWELNWDSASYYCAFINEEHIVGYEGHIIATVNGIRKDLYPSYVDWLDWNGFDIGDGIYLMIEWDYVYLVSKEIPNYDITFSVDAIDDFTIVLSQISGEFIDGRNISYPVASTSNWGITQLVNATNSTDTNRAATANAVRLAYNLADTANGARVTAGKKSGTTLGTNATAEGTNTTATGVHSHAEGYGTTAGAGYSHAEGNGTRATGYYSHAEGSNTIASAYYSHAEGQNTIAQKRSQHVFGEYNVADETAGASDARGSYVEIVGNGTGTSQRSNARTLDWDGNEVLAGKLTVGTAPTANMDVATKKYVDDNIPTVPTNVSSFTNDSGYLTLATLPIYDGSVV